MAKCHRVYQRVSNPMKRPATKEEEPLTNSVGLFVWRVQILPPIADHSKWVSDAQGLRWDELVSRGLSFCQAEMEMSGFIFFRC